MLPYETPIMENEMEQYCCLSEGEGAILNIEQVKVHF